MLDDFKQFILKGNVVDLSVAVVVGAAFNAVVNDFVTDVVNPAISATVGKPDFSAFVITVNHGKIQVGLFLNAVIAFLLVGTAVYLALVMPMNAIKRRMHPPAPATTRLCPECMSEINIAAKRCPQCGQLVAPPAPGAQSAPA